MGAKACKIEIQVERSEITAGDILRGRVAAQFGKAKTTPPTELTLVFLGQEIAHIEESSDSKSHHDRQYNSTTHATRRLCSIEVTLLRANSWKPQSSKTYVSHPFRK